VGLGDMKRFGGICGELRDKSDMRRFGGIYPFKSIYAFIP